MTDMPVHKKFERQIERIHQLLEVEGSTVTWNDRIPDPDNPGQPRQIDVSIRRDDSFTIVECRIHKQPQDVTWIEELIGRRISLKADAVIAVSASGFTGTANEKAKRHGIILRDLTALSREEIQNWGRKRTLYLDFCEFSEVVITFKINKVRGSTTPRLTDGEGKPLTTRIWRLLFQSIMHRLDEDKWTGAPTRIDAEAQARVLIDGEPPAAISLRANVRRVTQTVALASVVQYADPITSKGHAEVGHFKLGGSELIEHADNSAIVIDLSAIKIPDGCCFHTVTFDAGRNVNMRPNIIGAENAMGAHIQVQYQIEFARSA